MKKELLSQENVENIDQIIRNHVYSSMIVGFVPVPFLEFVAVTGIQLNMLRKLSNVYNIPFSKDLVKNLIGSLIGGVFPVSVGSRVAMSLIKIIPGFGIVFGSVSLSVAFGASTYAVGKVFNRHFAEGGTFLTFDPAQTKSFYWQMFKEGEKVTDELKKEKNNVEEQL